MRELMKMAFQFSWSLSLFGVQQLVNLITPAKAAGAFGNASRAMECELGELLHTAFRAGDCLQRGMVELALGSSPIPAAAGEPSRPGHAIGQPSADPPRPAAAGWGPMPYPVTAPSPESRQDRMPEPVPDVEISPDYPFEPHYIEVLGSRMHYVDVGSGDPILILHGNPTWSYIWRNIIPYLEPLGRCIAPDLIGYGRSDKPAIAYRWWDHVRYLEAFIEALRLKNVTLVLHDQGSGLGFHYATRHQDNVKGIAFFEAIIRPFPWDHFSTPEFREIFRRFRRGGRGGEGWRLIVEQNVFIEQLLPQAAARALTEREMDYYREPFNDPASRVPIWQFARDTPIGGEPRDVWQAVATYSEQLAASNMPKLLLYATPGALITKEHLDWAQEHMRNLETVHVGAGAHFLQESSPHLIGAEVARWVRRLAGGGRREAAAQR